MSLAAPASDNHADSPRGGVRLRTADPARVARALRLSSSGGGRLRLHRIGSSGSSPCCPPCWPPTAPTAARAKRYAVRFTAMPSLRLAAGTVARLARRRTARRWRSRRFAALVISLAKPQEPSGRHGPARLHHARHRPLGLDEGHRRQARPTDRRPGRRAQLPQQAPRRHPRRRGRLLRHARRRPGAQRRPRRGSTHHRQRDRRRRHRHRRCPASRHRRPPARPPERQAPTVGHRADLRRKDDHRLRPRHRSRTSPGSCASPSTPSLWATSTPRSPTPTPSGRPSRFPRIRRPYGGSPRRPAGAPSPPRTPTVSTRSTGRWARNWASRSSPRRSPPASRSARSRCSSAPAPPRCAGAGACPDRAWPPSA